MQTAQSDVTQFHAGGVDRDATVGVIEFFKHVPGCVEPCQGGVGCSHEEASAEKSLSSFMMFFGKQKRRQAVLVKLRQAASQVLVQSSWMKI